jgi:hypothetical protein
MNTKILVIVALIALGVLTIGFYEYVKPLPVKPAVVVDTRIELEKMGAVKMRPSTEVVAAAAVVTPAKVVAPSVAKTKKKPVGDGGEAAAYALAYKNAATANALLGRHAFFISANDGGKSAAIAIKWPS